MKLRNILISLLLFSCTAKQDRFQEWQDKEIKELLLEDKKNKELELIYLEEIRIAEENEDKDAFQYYFQEYINVPRLHIPDHLKEHPDYYHGGLEVKY